MSGAADAPGWPRVSVIVPVYNGGAGVRRLAASLLAQDYPGPAPELLFVDNGSTDAGFSDLAGLPVTRLCETRRGGPAARNCGARAAGGEVLAFIDQDCSAERRWLRRLVAPFDDPAVEAAAGETLTAPGTTAVARYLTRIRQNSAGLNLSRPVFPFAPANNLAVRRRLFDALGGFDEALPITDDADLSLRILRRAAGSIRFVPDALVFHEPRRTPRELFEQYHKYGGGWADLLLKHPDELRWTPWRAVQADLDVLLAGLRVAPAWLGHRSGAGAAAEYEFRRLDFVRRFAHRRGFVQQARRRGRWLW